METMTAIVQDEYGTAPEAVLRLAEIARPAIAADEILVRVRAASVDRDTWHLMAGRPYPMRLAGFGLRRPKAPNPGRSLAGTVESAGRKVTGFKPGDEVYGTCDGSSPREPFPAVLPERLELAEPGVCAGVGDGDQGLVGQSAQRIEDLAGRHLLVGTDGFGRGQAQPPLNTASPANRRRWSSNSRS